ncbi:MAG: hypothetical protein ACMG6S_25140 [Byssovorax sp.]
MKSPLAIVKEKFGDKSKLVEAVKAFGTEELWLGRTSADNGGGEGRGLQHVSNAKLVRLHTVFTEVKEKFGTRAKLIEEILSAQKRSKDGDLKTKLETYPVPRLFDLYKSVSKAAKAAEAKLAPKAPRAPKAEAKAAAPKAATKAVAKADPKAKKASKKK